METPFRHPQTESYWVKRHPIGGSVAARRRQSAALRRCSLLTIVSSIWDIRRWPAFSTPMAAYATPTRRVGLRKLLSCRPLRGWDISSTVKVCKDPTASCLCGIDLVEGFLFRFHESLPDGAGGASGFLAYKTWEIGEFTIPSTGRESLFALTWR